ncbi:MAG: hypothetical protein RMK00_05915 [Bacteroidota bacterium]|nr:hypothetical protein [Candidatus Kapabacteria bacterium]MCS7302325.1 hypothetical protein [Candidatus Kapabacteria bacterium]MCX7936930.1 hypothetical protein [Chlorobiota bacterium]MDW8075291.1 hypothetical protein [Bacteroidota bacterium]
MYPLVAILFIASVLSASGQIHRTTATLGYTATFLVNSPATRLIFTTAEQDTGSLYVTGSRFVGAQSGISFRYTQALDQAERWFLPVGIEAIFFRGKQRLENALYIGRGQVLADMFTATAGLHYRYADLPLAQAFLYAGIEPRISLVTGPQIVYTVSEKANNQVIAEFSFDTTLKPTVVRLGGALRLGAQGVLEDKLLINVNVAWGIFNLVGRDSRTTHPQRRGNLLTPTRIFETKEPLEQFIQFSLWLQYPL